MIVVKQKPIDEITAMVAKHRRVLIAGCNTCAAVALVGGEKQVNQLIEVLKLSLSRQGSTVEFEQMFVPQFAKMGVAVTPAPQEVNGEPLTGHWEDVTFLCEAFADDSEQSLLFLCEATTTSRPATLSRIRSYCCPFFVKSSLV